MASSATSRPNSCSERARLLARQIALLRCEAARGQKGRQHEQRQAHEAGRGGEVVAVGGDSGFDLQADVRQGPGHSHDARLRRGQPGRDDDDRDDEQKPFRKCEPGDLAHARAARTQQCRLHAPVVDEQRGGQHDRVSGHDRQLRHQQEHLCPGDEQ